MYVRKGQITFPLIISKEIIQTEWKKNFQTILSCCGKTKFNVQYRTYQIFSYYYVLVEIYDLA